MLAHASSNPGAKCVDQTTFYSTDTALTECCPKMREFATCRRPTRRGWVFFEGGGGGGWLYDGRYGACRIGDADTV